MPDHSPFAKELGRYEKLLKKYRSLVDTLDQSDLNPSERQALNQAKSEMAAVCAKLDQSTTADVNLEQGEDIMENSEVRRRVTSRWERVNEEIGEIIAHLRLLSKRSEPPC